MSKESPTARALIDYLATPAAAEIWAMRGGDFLSPNEKVPMTVYSVPQMATLAQAVASATTFRFPLADMKSATFRQSLNTQLERYLRTPAVAGDVVGRIAIAAGKKK
jgi:alpha-glucoside transport system substrate-binding protein